MQGPYNRARDVFTAKLLSRSENPLQLLSEARLGFGPRPVERTQDASPGRIVSLGTPIGFYEDTISHLCSRW